MGIAMCVIGSAIYRKYILYILIKFFIFFIIKVVVASPHFDFFDQPNFKLILFHPIYSDLNDFTGLDQEVFTV